MLFSVLQYLLVLVDLTDFLKVFYKLYSCASQYNPTPVNPNQYLDILTSNQQRSETGRRKKAEYGLSRELDLIAMTK